MPTSRQGSIRLFRFSGIDVFLHWSWFVVAAYEINGRTRSYSSLTWNVLEYLALLPLLFGLFLLNRLLGWGATTSDLYKFLLAVLSIDLGLLVFNMLPIYPLDGGQILRSLLWFVLGRARSLIVATILGFLGVAGFIILALRMHSAWFGVLSVFMLMNCWS